MSGDNSAPEVKSLFYPSYSEFSKTLRTWFVAFGIGGPVALMANENAWKAIVASECTGHIGALFLVGGAFQVICAFMNKHAMWHLYIAESLPDDKPSDKQWKEDHKKKRIYKLAQEYCSQNWTDEILDLYTLAVFIWATVLSFLILSAPSDNAFKCDHNKSEHAWIIGIIAAVLIAVLRYFLSFDKAPTPPEEPAVPPASPASPMRRGRRSFRKTR